MSKHPNALPDVVARKLSDLAREHGYGVENLTLSWLTKDLGQPATARVSYSTANDAPCVSVAARGSAVETARKQDHSLHGERILSNGEHTIRAGDIVTWDGDEDGWIVKAIREHGGLVEIARLRDDWYVNRTVVWAEALLP